MTTATASAGPDLPAPPNSAQDHASQRHLFAASGSRKTLICFIFLVLLPFYASLPFMLAMRISHGLIADSIGLGLLALAFTALMFWLLIIMMFSLRARVQLGEKDVFLTLPAGRGPTPMLRYKSYKLHYADIASVETRREIYGGSLVPVMMQGARLIMKDGSIIKLGYDAEANTDQAFPYVEIAHAIASHAGVPVIDQGHVRRSYTSKILGFIAPADAAVTDEEIAAVNAGHNRFILFLVIALSTLVVAGLAMDLVNPPSSDSAIIEGVEKPKKK